MASSVVSTIELSKPDAIKKKSFGCTDTTARREKCKGQDLRCTRKNGLIDHLEKAPWP